jgi:ankyrin repeat protein
VKIQPLLDRFSHFPISRLAIVTLIALACNIQGCKSQFFDVNGPLFKAVDSGDLGEVKALLKENPKLVSSRDNIGVTPLHLAAIRGYNHMAELLLARGANVNVRDNDGDTPLIFAAGSGHKNVAELLLTKGADVNAKNQHMRQTSLHLAAWKGYKDVAALLLANKVEVNARDINGMSALLCAFEEIPVNKEMVELLLDNKADVNSRDNDGYTALHEAAAKGERGIVELLVARGANVNSKNNYGDTPLHLAEGLKDMVELLRQHGGHE